MKSAQDSGWSATVARRVSDAVYRNTAAALSAGIEDEALAILIRRQLDAVGSLRDVLCATDRGPQDELAFREFEAGLSALTEQRVRCGEDRIWQVPHNRCFHSFVSSGWASRFRGRNWRDQGEGEHL